MNYHIDLHKLYDDDPRYRSIVAWLSESDIRPNYVARTADPFTAALYCEIPSTIQQAIGTQREICVWITLHSHAQARDIRYAISAIQSSQGRVDSHVLVVITADDAGHSVLREAGSDQSVDVVPYSLTELRRFKPTGPDHFRDDLRSQT